MQPQAPEADRQGNGLTDARAIALVTCTRHLHSSIAGVSSDRTPISSRNTGDSIAALEVAFHAVVAPNAVERVRKQVRTLKTCIGWPRSSESRLVLMRLRPLGSTFSTSGGPRV
jgi:hypothetical protein